MFCVALTIVAMISAAAGFLATRIPWESANTPAWVQAIGAIAAIAAAIWIGDHSNKQNAINAKSIADDLKKKRNSAMRAILDDLDMQCREVQAELELSTGFGIISFHETFHENKFKAALTAMEKITLHELESYAMVRGISTQRNAAISIGSIVASVQDIDRSDTDRDPTHFQEFWLRQSGLNYCKEARLGYEAAISELGGHPATASATKYTDMITSVMNSAEMVQAVVNQVVSAEQTAQSEMTGAKKPP